MTALQAEPVNQHCLLVIRCGYQVLKAEYAPYRCSLKHEIHSITKSIISALVGIAIERGYLKGTDQKLVDLFPGRPIANLDERKAAITLEHLLMMNSGLDWPENEIPYGLPENLVRRMYNSPDPVQFVLDRPMSAQPGESFAYNTGGSHLLSAILAQATGKPTLEFAGEVLFGPLGINDVFWNSDSRGLHMGGGGIQLTPFDLAKFGYLYLQGGRWKGRQVVPAEWVRISTALHVKKPTPPDYGYHWWIYPFGAPYPFGAYSAVGFGDQHIFVFPGLELVAVTLRGMNRGDPTRTSKHIESLLLPAVQSGRALPPNPSGVLELKSSLRRARQPKAQPVPPLPCLAARIQGYRYDFEDNNFQLRSLSLRFNQAEARLMLTNPLGAFELPVGLDGVYRITPTAEGAPPIPPTPPIKPGGWNAPCACKGAWQDEETFVMQQQVVGLSNRIVWTFRFEGEGVEVTLNPFNGPAGILTGRARPEKLVHITRQEAWEQARQAGEYRADSLETQGFIHLSRPEQVAGSANRFFKGQTGLVLLWIDSARVQAAIRFENLEGGKDLFPHLYGPLNLDAVYEVTPFEAQPDGIFPMIGIE